MQSGHKGKQEEWWRVFLRPRPEFRVEGLMTIRSPKVCWSKRGSRLWFEFYQAEGLQEAKGGKESGRNEVYL